MKKDSAVYENLYTELEDYEIDPEGHIESLSFVNINEKYRKNRRQKGQRAARRNSPFIQNG